MSLSIPGIKSILRCNAGTLSTTQAGAVYAGVKESATMKFTPFKTAKDERGRMLRNMMLGEISYNSLQATLKNLKSCIDHANMNCDVQLVSDKQTSSADSEDVFKFNSSSFLLGLGFKYELSLEKTVLTNTLKGAANYNTVKALIDAGDSEAIVAPAGLSIEDLSEYHQPNVSLLESAQGVSLFNAYELDDLKFVIQSEGKDTGLGQTTMHWLDISLDVTGLDAGVAKLVTLMTKGMSDSVLLKSLNAGSYYTSFDFASGALVQTEELELGNDSRKVQVKFATKVRPFELSWNFGATYGGAAADNGSNGGTVKIGY
jgi:hypothetical protein